MMNRHNEKKYLDKKWNQMQQRFKSFLRTGHGEQLHQFRIGVKKVRSFLTLLEAEEKNRGLLTDFKPVKRIFKRAGIVRDEALHQQQAEEQGILLQTLNQPDEQEKQTERNNLRKRGKKHLQTMKKVKKTLHKHLHSVSGNDMQIFFQDQIDTTHSLLSRHTFTERLHNGRKALKHLLYNQQVAEKVRNNKSNINFTYIDELQEVLGQWHDNKLAFDFFSRQSGTKNVHKLKTKSKALEKAVTEKGKHFLQRVRSY